MKQILLFFICFLLISCNKKEAIPPNILFIMSDDHAYQAISAYSDQLIQTPNIDKIAKEGMLFTNACVTNSICAPSRAVILTGKHSHINGKIDNRFPFDTSQMTFPQLFQNGGYQTAMFGKLHFGNEPKGLDQYKILPGQGTYYNPDFITKKEGKIRIEGYTTDIITDMTLDWLKNDRKKDQPFMLMYLHKAPHREWLPPERHYKNFTQKTFPEPETLFDNYEGRGSAAKEAEMNLLTHMNWAGDSKIYPEVMDQLGIPETSNWDKKAFEREVGRMTPTQRAKWDKIYGPINEEFIKNYPSMTSKDKMKWRYQRYMQDYLGSIAAVDDGVGQVLDYLTSAGLEENTIVIYTSDQGFYLGEHGWFDKRFIYDESFKTPLLVKWPEQISPGSKNTNMVQNLDFAPTLLEAARLPIPSDMQGESLIPLFKGQKESFRDAAYYHYYEYPAVHMVKRHYGIVTEEFKLIHFYDDIDEWELYDRKNDPQEMQNQIENPTYSDIIVDLKKRLEELRIQYGDSRELDQKYIDMYKN
ncbi:MAG: sulfatase [Saprospiraceae bacterium]|nr:sulfatase [Saprospiraceae bacterium]